MMPENQTSRREPVGVSRNVIKTTPNRITALWLFGIFIIASTVFCGTWFGAFLFGGLTDMAYGFGFAVTLCIWSVIGWFTIVLQDNAQDIKVKIIQG
jgi:ABC-type multidrug transport system permease subunit